MKDLVSGVVGNWEFFVGLLLVVIMLAGERGIWGTLEPWLRRRVVWRRPAPALQE
jgi:ABC-type branched-subunit amino acid transport system permease subunit